MAYLIHYCGLLNINTDAFTMRTKLRCIHTLNGGNAIAEITGMGNEQRIFEHIGSFSQVAKKEIGAGILSAFVIA